MSGPIILTERERAVFAELVSHLMGEANNRDTEYAWQIGEVLRAWLRDMEPPTESASPPRGPEASAQFAKVGVQSGPGQPIEALAAIRAAMIAVESVGADPRLTDAVNFLHHAQMRLQHFQSGAYLEPLNVVISAAEIRRLRAQVQTERRAGIEEAAQYCIEGDVLLPDQAKAMVRALAAAPPADEMELRPEVAVFARLMERELRTNDARRGAAGWKGMTAAELLRMLDADAAKLRFALGAGDATKAIEQCADVANMAMMIADVTEIAARKGG